MYSYSDENFIMNSILDNDKCMYYSSLFNNETFDGVIELGDLNEFLAALDEYVMQNPHQIDSVVKYLREVVKNPQAYFTSGLAEQHIEAAPRILYQKIIQYDAMKEGKEYEANCASLEARKISLESSHDVGLEMGLDDVLDNIEHDIHLIDLRKKIEVAKHKVSTDPQWQQRLNLLQNEYDEAIKSKKI